MTQRELNLKCGSPIPSIDFKNHALERSSRSLASMAGPGPGQKKPILVPILVPILADEKFLSRSDTAQTQQKVRKIWIIF